MTDQQILFEAAMPLDDQQRPVTCLGRSFPNDDARRDYFTERLREHLADPAFRAIEGFPQGSDDDILAISDPPYYTACPNPFLGEFIAAHGTTYDPAVPYGRHPFAVDVSEGKTDPVYMVHSYHTKVPHKAIMPAILHYTQPGDLVLDGFGGSGMTGVAAQLCGAPDPELRAQIESEWRAMELEPPTWGARRAVLNDLGPAATFIEANYTTPFDVHVFAKEAQRILTELANEIGWMYTTRHTDGTTARINYTVWSEVFACPDCGKEIVFSEEALDESGRVREAFVCPHCQKDLGKKDLERIRESVYDPATKDVIQRPKRKPILINYSINKAKFEKAPDSDDLTILANIERELLPITFPTNQLPHMHMTHQRARMDLMGVTHIHHFYLPRAAQALGHLWEKVHAVADPRTRNMLLFLAEQAVWGLSIMNRYKPLQYGRLGGNQTGLALNGVYYVPSISSEVSPWYNFESKLARMVKVFREKYVFPNTAIVSTGSAAKMLVPDHSIDYIFTDPPFGENIYYADLNFLVESWHRVWTNAGPEAIIDQAKHKALVDYQRLMAACFTEYFRVLKPGRWMTVVFHNSRNNVWTAIQEAMNAAGFIIADVRTLDKQQRSYRQVTSTAVKQDLIISAYKANGGLEQRFELTAGTTDGVWDFTRTHLRQLAVFVAKNNRAEVIAGRLDYLLYDRVVAFHVQRGVTVPYSAPEFYRELEQRFPRRDNMYFLSEQIGEYERKRLSASEIQQLEFYVIDEASAIRWLRQQLTLKPQSFADLTPEFMRVTDGWQKHELQL